MAFEDINYALVEEKRPPIYTAMKYWGKKPHNIWRKYIENYTPTDGVYLDPFAGSAISAFESVKAGRKCIAFDLNPLTSFLIEVYCKKFEQNIFSNEVNEIVNEVKKDKIYNKFYLTKCRKCGNKKAIIQNFKWEGENIYEVGIDCESCNERYLEKPNGEEMSLLNEIDKIEIDTWFPKDTFYDSPSFTANFISCLGGNNFYNLYTKRNLYIISKIFSKIEKTDDNIKKHLLFGFIQTIHLCSKMSVPRRPDANRGFSTSWGRSAYICSNRKMEMNPLLTFERNCIGSKQSVKTTLNSVFEYLGKMPKIVYVDYSNKGKDKNNYDIKYGIVDINNISSFINPKSIDFILTDPPYGDLVQYLDLSSIWLIWLKKIDDRFAPKYDNEIIIKRNVLDFETYKRKFESAIKNLNNVLKDEGKAVFTFHNKKIQIWNTFLHSLRFGGFNIEKVIHQQNRRTGEANVANPYGTSATDFYLRCIKNEDLELNNDEKEFRHYVVETAKKLIALRNEPTPYQILFNGILAEISLAGFDIENFDEEINIILSKEVGTTFELKENNENNAGSFWWFKNPNEVIDYPDRSLKDRVDETISRFLRKNVSVSFDDVLKEIFLKYPNGLTPDIRDINVTLKKYANKQAGRWNWKGGSVEKTFTKHTEILYALNEIGRKYKKNVYIGKREQPEEYEGNRLSVYIDIKSLNDFKIEKGKKERIEMIDMLWVIDKKIEYAIEVENSTNFTSGIQRASNLEDDVKKIMVIPDERKKEFLRLKDPLFVESFRKYNWSYMFYSDVSRLQTYREVKEKDLDIFLNKLK